MSLFKIVIVLTVIAFLLIAVLLIRNYLKSGKNELREKRLERTLDTMELEVRLMRLAYYVQKKHNSFANIAPRIDVGKLDLSSLTFTKIVSVSNHKSNISKLEERLEEAMVE